MVRGLHERLRRLEVRSGIDREQRICDVCGSANGGLIIWEKHLEDGSVVYKPHPPCEGCKGLWPPGRVSCILICGRRAKGHYCSICDKPPISRADQRQEADA
jgi:hypothetical protein